MNCFACISALLFLSCAVPAHAEVIFDLYSEGPLQAALDDEPGPIHFTIDGITATFSTPDGVMNRSSKGFGVNGSDDDETFALDHNDALDVSFNADITITELDFRNFTEPESVTVSIGTLTDGTYTASSARALTEEDLTGTINVDSITGLELDVAAGQVVRFTATNWSDTIAIDSITIIPEPACVALLLMTGSVMMLLRRVFA